jgi:hypothetical protein
MQWEVVRAANEQHALGACIESLQGHVIISLSLHGRHLSRNPRTFLARLSVPSSSSELDLRATAHIQRCGQTPRRYGVYLIPSLRPLFWGVPGGGRGVYGGVRSANQLCIKVTR